MVPEALVRGVVHAEAFVFGVIVLVHGAAGPVLVALDAKMVVALNRQRGQAGTGLQDALGQGDTGGDTTAQHFLHGNVRILCNVFFLHRLRPYGKRQKQGYKKDNDFFHHSIVILRAQPEESQDAKLRRKNQIS